MPLIDNVFGVLKIWEPLSLYFVVVQSLSYIWLFATSWTVALQDPLSSTIFWSLPRFMSIESVMPSNHVILCHSLFLLPSIFPSIRVFSNELTCIIYWPKYWSLGFNTSEEYSGLPSFRVDWFDLHVVQRIRESSPAPQFKNINSSVLSLLYGPTLTSICEDYWKNYSFDYTAFDNKEMSLLFNTLSRFVIAFLNQSLTCWGFIKLTEKREIPNSSLL